MLLWTGASDACGYGYLRCHPRFGLPFPTIARVHRLAYWLLRGPFDLDLTLNHDCTTRLCVNPYHLTPMTHGENCADANLRRWRGEEAGGSEWGDWLDDDPGF